jgi:hypothetical protein
VAHSLQADFLGLSDVVTQNQGYLFSVVSRVYLLQLIINYRNGVAISSGINVVSFLAIARSIETISQYN